MASAVEHRQFHERRSAERRRIGQSPMMLAAEGMRVSWGGIFGGVLVALGVLLLLAALGVAVLLMGYLAASGVGTLASGAFSLVSGATQAVGAVFQGGGPDLSSGDVDQMIARLKDPNTARQIATATGLPQAEVQSTLSEVAQRVDNARENPAQAAAEVRQGVAQLYEKARASGAIERRAEELQPRASQAAWITFGALVLSLLAAVLGAMLGRRRAYGQARAA